MMLRFCNKVGKELGVPYLHKYHGSLSELNFSKVKAIAQGKRAGTYR